MLRGSEGQRWWRRAAARRAVVRPVLLSVRAESLAGLDGEAVEDEAVALPPETPEHRGGARTVHLELERRTLIAALLVAAGVLVAGLIWLSRSQPRDLGTGLAAAPAAAATGTPAAVGGTRPTTGTAARTTEVAGALPTSTIPVPSSGAGVVVDVSGKVRRPGVYRLPAGSRVVDAVRAAGGAKPGVDLSSLNLARPLADGEQVAVGSSAGVMAPATPGLQPAATGSTSGGPVDLNTATLEQLDSLPGVGPVLAQRILDYRTAHGRFQSVDQLNSVSGIGDAKFADLAPLVTVS